MREWFSGADKNANGTLSLKEVVELFRLMNLKYELDEARKLLGVSVKVLGQSYKHQLPSRMLYLTFAQHYTISHYNVLVSRA